MKTRKAVIVLRNQTIVAENINDADWADFLRLNESWRRGRSGGVDFNYRLPGRRSIETVSFDYGDVVRIDLWPGSEEPR